jgi:phage gpG-like protein
MLYLKVRCKYTIILCTQKIINTMTPQQFERKIKQQSQLIKQNFANKHYSYTVAGAALRFVDTNFRAQQWHGASSQPWKQRKKLGNGRSILVKPGWLRRSVRIIRIEPLSVTIGSDVPYAKAHNEGFRGRVAIPTHSRTTTNGTATVQAHSRNMNLPKRQFLGASPVLTAQAKRTLTAEIMKAFRT